jgi:hypothetical protein
MAIQRHLVAPGRVRDRVDAGPSYPVFAKEIPGSADDALSRLERAYDAVLHDRSSTFGKNVTLLDRV